MRTQENFLTYENFPPCAEKKIGFRKAIFLPSEGRFFCFHKEKNFRICAIFCPCLSGKNDVAFEAKLTAQAPSFSWDFAPFCLPPNEEDRVMGARSTKQGKEDRRRRPSPPP